MLFRSVKALRERHEETWRIVEDDTLQAGGCRVETEHSRIDATIETRISQALAKMFDQLHDQALHPAPADMSLDLGTVVDAPVIADDADDASPEKAGPDAP